jgi:hypothetical protein
MIQHSDGTCFMLEAFGELLLRKLDGDDAIEAGIACSKTSPIPPVSMGATISYGPSFVPMPRLITAQWNSLKHVIAGEKRPQFRRFCG